MIHESILDLIGQFGSGKRNHFKLALKTEFCRGGEIASGRGKGRKRRLSLLGNWEGGKNRRAKGGNPLPSRKSVKGANKGDATKGRNGYGVTEGFFKNATIH